MRTTIDRGGRIVVPKAIRDRLQLAPGASLDIAERDGTIELVPVPAQVSTRSTPEGPVAVPAAELPPLTDDDVRRALDAIRR